MFGLGRCVVKEPVHSSWCAQYTDRPFLISGKHFGCVFGRLSKFDTPKAPGHYRSGPLARPFGDKPGCGLLCSLRLEFDVPAYPATSAILLAMRLAADLTGSLARWA